MEQSPFESIFSDLDDPRVERTRRHKLIDIVMIVLIGTLCDQRGWGEIFEYAEVHERELRTILELPNGIPCADTYRRVMGALEPKQLRAVLLRWARRLHENVGGNHIAIDGKAVRGAFAEDRGALHLVNAWVTETKIVLGHLPVADKSNEITAIPDLLELLALKNAVITIDAMGCQKKIAQTIVDKGADYLFGLKGNHPTLHEDVVTAFDADTCKTIRENPNDFCESADKGHGRLETRRTYVMRDIAWLTQSEQWPGLCTILMVESERTVRGVTSLERRAYISSSKAPAKRCAEHIRSHWGVENQLHWVLDVSFGEDRVRASQKYGAENLAVLRKIALNLLQNAPILPKEKPTRRKSIVSRKRRCNWDFPYLLRILAAGISEN